MMKACIHGQSNHETLRKQMALKRRASFFFSTRILWASFWNCTRCLFISLRALLLRRLPKTNSNKTNVTMDTQGPHHSFFFLSPRLPIPLKDDSFEFKFCTTPCFFKVTNGVWNGHDAPQNASVTLTTLEWLVFYQDVKREWETPKQKVCSTSVFAH